MILNKTSLPHVVKNILFSRNEPVSIVHFLTNRCNARCSFCFIDFDNKDTFKGELTLNEIERLTKTYGKSLLNVNFTGGEPFARKDITDIAKKLLISAGTVHVRVKKMEDAGIIKGSSLTLDYKKLGYTFIAYIGIFLEKTHQTKFVLQRLEAIPFVTVAHITTGKFNIFCKVRAKSTDHAKEIIFLIDDVEGVSRTETMISLEESINDKKRLMHRIFNELQ